jgi:hypothetical protein
MNTEIQKIVIVDGQWSTNGNFSGWDILAVERYHIPARLMATLGYKKDDVVQMPLFATVVKKSFSPRLDKDGNPIPNADGTFGIKDRPTVTSLFKTKQDGVNAFVDATGYSRDVDAALRAAESAANAKSTTLAKLEELG